MMQAVHILRRVLNGRVWAMGDGPVRQRADAQRRVRFKGAQHGRKYDPRQGSVHRSEAGVIRAFWSSRARRPIYVIGGSPPVACIIFITVQHCKGHRLLRT